jgi:hypothetical protein
MSLLALGVRTNNTPLRRQILQGVRELTRPGKAWGDKVLSLSPEQVQQLGDMALEESPAGDAAAELIGHFRAAPAVQVVVNHHNQDRGIAALLLVQQVAGSLPAQVRGGVRFRLKLEWALQRFLQQPASLIGAYALAFLGSALGIGIQVYLTYNWPDFFDILRITTSLEQGLIVGAIFGLGIFLARVIVERFQTSRAPLRLLLGTFAGGVVMNIAMLAFHVLFRTAPQGMSITVACLLIALVFAAGSFARSYLLRVLLSSAVILAVTLVTWWIHIGFAASSAELTPIFRFDPASWTWTQVTLIALGTALPIGIFGNLVRLSLHEE